MIFARLSAFIAIAGSVTASPLLGLGDGNLISADSLKSDLLTFNGLNISTPSVLTDLLSRGDYQAPSGYTGGSCSSEGCNEKDVLKIFTDLKGKVSGSFYLLDGHKSPIGPCNDIITHINEACQSLYGVQINTSAYGSLCAEIVAIFCEILFGIIECFKKYTFWTILFLCVKIDLALVALLKACIILIPGFIILVAAAIKFKLSVLSQFAFLAVLKICGLY